MLAWHMVVQPARVAAAVTDGSIERVPAPRSNTLKVGSEGGVVGGEGGGRGRLESRRARAACSEVSTSIL